MKQNTNTGERISRAEAVTAINTHPAIHSLIMTENNSHAWIDNKVRDRWKLVFKPGFCSRFIDAQDFMHIQHSTTLFLRDYRKILDSIEHCHCQRCIVEQVKYKLTGKFDE